MLASGLRQEAAKRNDRGEAGEVQEDPGGDALHGQSVLVVADVPGHLSLHVIDEPAKESACPGQPRLLPQPLLLLLLIHLLFGQLWRTLSHILRGNGRRWLYTNGGIPFAGWENGDRIQELIHAGQQVIPLPGSVGHLVKDLIGHQGGHSPANLMEVALTAGRAKQDEDESVR